MFVNRDALKRLIDIIPEQDALELYNFLDYLNMKREKRQLNSDVDLLSEDKSLIDQIIKTKEDFKMTTNRYQKGLDKLMELTIPDSDNPTGHMDIGEGFKDIAC